MSTVTVLVFYSGILFLLNNNMFYFSGWIVSYTYYALFSNFKPDVFNPLVLICGCLLYYKLGAIFIHIKYNTAKSRRKKGTIPNYSAHDLSIVFIQWFEFWMPFLAYVDRMYVGLSACLIITYLTLLFSLVMMIIKAKNSMLHLRRS